MSEPRYTEPRGPGVTRVRISLGTDPITGKRYRPSKTVHGSAKDVALARAQMLAGVGRLNDSRMTVSEFIDGIFLPYQESRVTASKIRRRTADGYAEKARLYVVPHLGTARLCDLSPDLCDRWLLAIANTGISERTQLHAYRVFSLVLDRAKRAALVSSNPLADVEPPHPELKRPDVLTVDEVGAYLDAFRGTPLCAAVVASLGAGLRRSEAVGLDWGRGLVLESQDAGYVLVDHGVHQRGGAVWDEAPKSATSRRVLRLPAWAARELWPLRGLGPVLIEGGERMTPNRYSYHYRRHVEASGLRYVPLKNLRHTHATLMLEATRDLKAVSVRMGHSESSVTDRYYIGAREDADARMAAAFDTLILGPVGAMGPVGATSVRKDVHG